VASPASANGHPAAKLNAALRHTGAPERRDGCPDKRLCQPRVAAPVQTCASCSNGRYAEPLITPFPDGFWSCAALFGAVALSVDAPAQINRAAAVARTAVNPMCPRLEAQLATTTAVVAAGDPAKEEQIRRYQDAAAKQQSELDRAHLAGQAHWAATVPDFLAVQRPVGAMRSGQQPDSADARHLEQITTSLERLRSGGFGGAERDSQRRSVLAALAQTIAGRNMPSRARPGQFPGNSVRQ